MKYLIWSCKISFHPLLLLIFIFNSCAPESPYPEFETNLKKAICKCVRMSNTLNKDQFLSNYENCVKGTSDILKIGLAPYQEHPTISKEKYLEKLPELINKLSALCALES